MLSKKRITLGLAAVLAFGAALLSPALADPRWDRDDGHRHRYHGSYERGPAPVVVVERPRPVYIAPRPRIVYEEPVYVWYPPPPPRVAYYPPPGVSLTFNFD